MKRRTKLAPGIWRDQYGIAVVVRSNQHGYAEERFPHDTPIRTLKARRDELRVELRSTRRRRASTLDDDATIYLAAVKALATYATRERHIQLWLDALDAQGRRFGSRPRHSIAPHEIQAQRDAWRLHGPRRRYDATLRQWVELAVPLSASDVNHRLRALSNLYTVLEPKGENPVRLVAECDEPEAVPRAIPLVIANAIFAAMPPSHTKARLEVLATTGIEQATFAVLTAADVDLEAGTVHLPRRHKGHGAAARLLPLTPAGVSAFRQVAKWDAWGAYSTGSAYRSFKRACRHVEETHNAKAAPADRLNLGRLRPKDLRHTFGTALSVATNGNVRTIQQFLHHATDVMADRYRKAAIPQHLRDAAAQLTKRRLTVTGRVSGKSGKLRLARSVGSRRKVR